MKDLEYSALKVLLADGEKHSLSEIAASIGESDLSKVWQALGVQVEKGAVITDEDETDPTFCIDPEYAGYDDLKLAVATDTKITTNADGSATISARDFNEDEEEEE